MWSTMTTVKMINWHSFLLLLLLCGCTDNGKPPVVTYNDDGSISIDRLDPGESVELELECEWNLELQGFVCRSQPKEGLGDETVGAVPREL